MQIIKLIIIVSIISIFSQSCRKGGPWGIRGKGSNVTETRDLKDFDRIQLSIDADVYYTQDSVYKVEISAQSNILTVLKVEVSGSELKLDFKRNVWDHNKIKITVHSPNLKGLSISGSGDINVQNSVNTSDLELNISGSGNIYLPFLNSQNVSARISGTGDIKIAGGGTKTETLTVSGSGNIDAKDFVAENCTAKISGLGDISVHATEILNVTISGTGDVSYRGKPSVSSDISGLGKLIHLD